MITLSEDKLTNPAAFRVKTKLGGALRIFLRTAGDLVTGLPGRDESPHPILGGLPASGKNSSGILAAYVDLE
jgi:hypothetical protein